MTVFRFLVLLVWVLVLLAAAWWVIVALWAAFGDLPL